MMFKRIFLSPRWESRRRKSVLELSFLTKGGRAGFANYTAKKSSLAPFHKRVMLVIMASPFAARLRNISLLSLITVTTLVTSCAPARPYRPRPIERYPSAQEPITTPPPVYEPRTSQPTPQDAVDCERQAAMAGAGSKAAVFNECMRNRAR